MTTTYTKSLASDFSGNLSTTQLQSEINEDTNISPDCLGVFNINNDNVDIIFDSALSAGEQTTLNSLISGHIANTNPPKENFYTYIPRDNYASSTSYKRLGGPFKYSGQDIMGTINYIEVISYKMANPTSYSVRIYDVTNQKTIAEKTNLTNTEELVNDLGTISNIPSEKSLLEVQVKRVGGSGGNKNNRIYVEEVLIYYDN